MCALLQGPLIGYNRVEIPRCNQFNIGELMRATKPQCSIAISSCFHNPPEVGSQQSVPKSYNMKMSVDAQWDSNYGQRNIKKLFIGGITRIREPFKKEIIKLEYVNANYNPSHDTKKQSWNTK